MRKDTWIEGDCRYTEWKIPQHNTVYVLGDFRTLSHEPSAYDMDSDISALLAEWKRDHAALLARFDRNHDGTIDLDEWEQARQRCACRGGEELPRNAGSARTQRRAAPRDGRPYLISNMSQRELAGKYRLWIWVHVTSFIAAMAGLGWNLIS